MATLFGAENLCYLGLAPLVAFDSETLQLRAEKGSFGFSSSPPISAVL